MTGEHEIESASGTVWHGRKARCAKSESRGETPLYYSDRTASGGRRRDCVAGGHDRCEEVGAVESVFITTTVLPYARQTPRDPRLTSPFIKAFSLPGLPIDVVVSVLVDVGVGGPTGTASLARKGPE